MILIFTTKKTKPQKGLSKFRKSPAEKSEFKPTVLLVTKPLFFPFCVILLGTGKSTGLHVGNCTLFFILYLYIIQQNSLWHAALAEGGIDRYFCLSLFFFFMRGGERKGEKHQCVVPCHMPRTGDLAHNPGMCPDWELNWQPFGSQTSAQSTELHQPGQCFVFFAHYSISPPKTSTELSLNKYFSVNE